jgi:SAM-dependent methyltransferase
VNLCKMRGLSATQTDFFDASLDDQRFDAIIMSELIEHVPAPARFLRRAYELLEDDGLLYLTTPNFGSLARRLLGEAWSVIHPEHIGYFNRRTLRRMATREAGLREIKIEANNISPSTLVALVHRSRGESRHAGSEAHRNARTGVDQRLRRTIQGNRVLSTTKEGLNSALTLTGLGDTLVAWLQKPAG